MCLSLSGHADMGGTVIMSAEAAFHAGAGKSNSVWSVMPNIIKAILARSPNIMVRDINSLDQNTDQHLLTQLMDAYVFGMRRGMNGQSRFI